jgi:hypothetical protein
MTANPNWPEVTHSLPYGQKPQDRPDVIARVFKAKLDELMTDLKTRHVMGRCVAHAYAVEFQARGLPHAHSVIVLEKNDRPVTDADVDLLCSAEIPPLPPDDDHSAAAETPEASQVGAAAHDSQRLQRL